MYERVLVATDGSSAAEDAVHRALDLAAAIGLPELHIVSAGRPLTLHELERVRHELPAEFRDLVDADVEAETHLASAQRLAHSEQVESVLHVVAGDPVDAILGTADDIDADLVVVGSRQLSSAERLVHGGSVSARVARHSHCDVLVVEHRD